MNVSKNVQQDIIKWLKGNMNAFKIVQMNIHIIMNLTKIVLVNIINAQIISNVMKVNSFVVVVKQ